MIENYGLIELKDNCIQVKMLKNVLNKCWKKINIKT